MMFEEERMTLQYMEKYGIDNCRGGKWCRRNLKTFEKLEIIRQLKYYSDKCLKCGKTKHDIKEDCEFYKPEIYQKKKKTGVIKVQPDIPELKEKDYKITSGGILMLNEDEQPLEVKNKAGSARDVIDLREELGKKNLDFRRFAKIQELE